MRATVAFLVAATAVGQTSAPNLTHVWGRVESVGKSRFVIDQNYNADPHSAYQRQNRRIVMDSHTRFEESERRDLRAGRTVDILGTKDGSAVRAVRVIVYEGNRPVRMPAGTRAILPNGSVGSLR
jgi:hypothetical protein